MIATGPGSLAWLLRHELRLTWRSYLGAWGRGVSERRARIRLICLAVGLHVVAVPIALVGWMFPVEATQQTLLTLSGGILVVFSLMLSQSLFGVTQALYMRGDLDLLLSSPLSARKMLTVRALAIAMNAISAWALLSLPFVDLLVLLGQFHWLAVYPMLLCIGALATAVGLGLSMALFATIGPARTRTTAQVLAALIAVAGFLTSQAQSFLPAGGRRVLSAWIGRVAHTAQFDYRDPLWLPARALLGEALPLCLCVTAALAVFAVAVLVFGQAFSNNAMAIASLATRPAQALSRPDRPPRPFRTGVRPSLLRKEWRLLLRDPWLISQILLQILYLLPICFIYWRQTQSDRAALSSLAMMTVVVAGHLAGGLIWITISSEDSPDLLASAPIAGGEVLRAKLIAALAPVAAILVLPLAAIALELPLAGVWAALGCLASAFCATLLGLWYQKPAKRRTFMLRRKGSTLVNLTEMILNFCWGLATAFVIAGSPWALAFVVTAVVVLGGLRLIADPGPSLAVA